MREWSPSPRGRAAQGNRSGLPEPVRGDACPGAGRQHPQSPARPPRRALEHPNAHAGTRKMVNYARAG